MVGIVVYSVAGFSYWIFISLILAAFSAGIAAALNGYVHQTILFLIVISFLLGYFRAASYQPSFSTEKTFWDSSRMALVSKIDQILPRPESALFGAMVFGYQKEIPQELKNDFNRTGTTHILAISGMNISIVVLMLMNFGLMLGLWRRQAFWLALIGIVIFILLVGSPASAVRAGVMGALLLWAKNRGRLVLVWRPIVLAAFFMTIFDPSLLMFNIGFQLSFLAVAGIAYFNNFWSRVFRWIPIKFARELIAISMAAQITTWPIILYNFGTVSLISPLANIFIVPLLTPIMFLGLGFALVFWSTLLAQLFLWPAWLILHFVTKLVSWFGAISWASVDLGAGGLIFVLIYYPALIWFYKFLEKRNLN
jgi:competence protein ComEC